MASTPEHTGNTEQLCYQSRSTSLSPRESRCGPTSAQSLMLFLAGKHPGVLKVHLQQARVATFTQLLSKPCRPEPQIGSPKTPIGGEGTGVGFKLSFQFEAIPHLDNILPKHQATVSNPRISWRLPCAFVLPYGICY